MPLLGGNVKKVMKNHSEEYGKTRDTLPLAAARKDLWPGGKGEGRG
jgi:hypothetical protein